MQQSIRPVRGARLLLAMMRIRFSSPHKVLGLGSHVIVQAEERRSVPSRHHPPRISPALLRLTFTSQAAWYASVRASIAQAARAILLASATTVLLKPRRASSALTHSAR